MIDSTWTWRKLVDTTPGKRYAHAMASDGAGRVLLCGGTFWNGAAFVTSDDTFELVGDTWTLLTPATSPGVRTYNHMLHDGSRYLMYGGRSAPFVTSSDLNDLQEFVGGDWNVLSPATTPPVDPFFGGGTSTVSHLASQLVWDGTRALILYPNSGNELWGYASADWSMVASGLLVNNGYGAVGSSHGNLNYIGMCWAGDRLVACGGQQDVGTSFNFTDEYDGVGTGWTEPVANGVPGMWSHRSRHKLLWVDGGVYMFGGMEGTVGTIGEPCRNDSWVYDTATSTWTNIAPGGTPPSARQFYDMVFDGRRVVLMGGTENGTGGGSGPPNNETWVLERPLRGLYATTEPHSIPLSNPHLSLQH